MLWAVGLRGAVAYGLVVNLPRTDEPGQYGIPAIETATLLIVVASTLILAPATGARAGRLLAACTHAMGWAGLGWAGQGLA